MACRKFISCQSTRITQNPRWFTSVIKHKLYLVRSACRKFKRSATSYNSDKLLTLKQDLQLSIINAITQFEKNLVNDFAFNSNAGVFNYIRSLSSHSSLLATVYLGTKMSNTDMDKETLFNESVFITTFADSLQSLPPCSEVLNDLDITVPDIYKALSSLKCPKTPGIDNLPLIFFQKCVVLLCESLCYLFKECINQSYLPLIGGTQDYSCLQVWRQSCCK